MDRGTTAALAEIRLHEPDRPREISGWLAATLAGEPWPQVMGPLLDRGAPNGGVWIGGEEVARWGDPGRRKMTFSIAESALGTVAGLAFDDGLLPDLDEPVALRRPRQRRAGRLVRPDRDLVAVIRRLVDPAPLLAAVTAAVPARR